MARSTRSGDATRVDALMRAVDAVADALGDAGEANHRAFRDDAERIATALERTLTRDEDADAFAVLGVEHTVSMWTTCVDAWTRAAETRAAALDELEERVNALVARMEATLPPPPPSASPGS